MASKHLVFVLHGMGQASKGWADAGIKTLRDGWKKLELTPRDYGLEFEFFQIDYNETFDRYWNAVAQHSSRFSGLKIPATSPDALRKLVPVIADLDASSPWITHLSDVVLYRSTRHGDLIAHEISVKIHQALKDRGSPRYSFIAHSLGTAVVTDVVRMLLSDDFPTFRDIAGKPDTFMMMGNVSRLLERNNLFSLSSGFFPSRASGKGICRDYIDVNHPLDPFTWLRPFNPPERWGGIASNNKRYHKPSIERNDLVPPINPHSFEHYLSHPNVQVEFFRRTVTGNPTLPIEIDKNILNERLKKYRDTTLKGEVRAFADELLAMPNSKPHLLDNRIAVVEEFLNTLEAFTLVGGKND